MKKRYNKQNPEIRRHGPKSKKIVYKESIDKVMDEGYLDDWKTSEEIAWKANKYVSNYWTPLSRNIVPTYLKRTNQVKWRRKPGAHKLEWKKL
tara:strand:- start:279 stop:557 length:279 start_codon:yes stop_codon:yes gene_type:complete